LKKQANPDPKNPFSFTADEEARIQREVKAQLEEKAKRKREELIQYEINSRIIAAERT